MNKKMFKKIAAICLLAASLSADGIGVVNFANCISDSKLGKAEQANFENLKKQLGTHLEATEKELNDLAAKLNDSEYMDGLSPEADAELREKVRALNEELMRYQNQYYQVLNQTNMKIVQQISAKIASAAETVAKAKKIDAVLNQEACFYANPSLNVTDDVVKEMDLRYDEEMKNQAKAEK
ncbi:MAG: OmpH family outer membrane protein [Verrucomicrobia bacterium]|nr:OmpH family outer membrane protein [Verrucomicrobiota bacterium]